MNFSINQLIKIIDEYNEYNANIDDLMENKIAITAFDAVGVFTSGETVIAEITGNDAVYLGQVTILSVIDGTKNSSCVMSQPSSFSRMQRREYVRMKAKMKLSYLMEGKDDTEYNGVILDLSGKGVQLSSEIELPINTVLKLQFTFTGSAASQLMKVKAKVVRRFKTLGGLQYGLLFIDLTPEEQDRIVKYILHESVKKRSISFYLSQPY